MIPKADKRPEEQGENSSSDAIYKKNHYLCVINTTLSTFPPNSVAQQLK